MQQEPERIEEDELQPTITIAEKEEAAGSSDAAPTITIAEKDDVDG